MKKSIVILLVDDEPAVLRLFGSQLAKAGFEILPAHDGNEGREMARRLQPDLILLDQRMPVMDGLETLSRLKEEDPTKDIPVILFTIEDLSIEAQKAASELGLDAYINKGSPIEEIVTSIKKVLHSYGHDVS